ncbi:Serine/arginine-rich splicing factor SR45a [Bienertia sinuspersici]
MSNSREERSPSPDGSASPEVRHQRPRSRSRSPPPRHSQSGSPEDVSNPGNNLYVTGLSTRVSNSDLEEFFSQEGKVRECCLVTDPRTKESRGFAFVTMETREQAERCIKNLNRSVLEGRLVTVEKAKRSRGRTPTPGRYQGVRKERGGPVEVEVVDDLAVSPPEDGLIEAIMTEILIHVIGERDPALLMEGEQMITLTPIGVGVGNGPCHQVVVATHEKERNLERERKGKETKPLEFPNVFGNEVVGVSNGGTTRLLWWWVVFVVAQELRWCSRMVKGCNGVEDFGGFQISFMRRELE